MTFFLIAVAALLFVVWLLGEPRRVALRRARVRRRPFPDGWRDILKRRVPYFRKLPADLQLQLKKHIQVFLDEKPFVGCAGLQITDEMRVTIAAQACLLILNRRSDYFPALREVLVYPGRFVAARAAADASGVLHAQRHVLSGESWARGQVVLSWDDALDGASVVDDGHNVVIHEFAHQLDQETGAANGAPWLGRQRARYVRWARVLGAAFALLQAHAAAAQPSLFDHYGATNPAEFFAVASEVFFERPQELAHEYPELYGELAAFYRVSPLSWQ